MTAEQFNYGLFGLELLGLPVALFLSPWAPDLWPALLFVAVQAFAVWGLSLWLNDASIVDIYWGPALVSMAWWYALQVGWDALGLKQWLVLTLISLWGLRLGIYLGWRNWGQAEDYRYTRMRQQAGDQWWWISLFKVFFLQGLIIWTISSLFWIVFNTNTSFVWTDTLALVLWCIGFFFEAVGDCQLARFKAQAENKGEVLNKGLWRYTRHPNYFGDACVWWAYFLFALGHPQALWFIFSPIYMTFLLLKISGVAMLEKDQQSKQEAKYEAYIQQTSAFIPWPPKEK